jgi:hypothetical protein
MTSEFFRSAVAVAMMAGKATTIRPAGAQPADRYLSSTKIDSLN